MAEERQREYENQIAREQQIIQENQIAYQREIGQQNQAPLQAPQDSYSNGPDASEIDAPTASHALAATSKVEYPEEKGAAQIHGEKISTGKHPVIPSDADDHTITDMATANLGWREAAEKVPDPLVGGVPNEVLWTLVRRFDKQVQHVRVTHDYLPGDLDLNVSKDEQFSPDRLRANVERLYMTVIIGLVTFVKHIARIRSWEDKERTATFCAVYFLGWVVDLLTPLAITTLILLIVYPPARSTIFPPAAIATIDSKTGQAKTPASGHLGSHDSMTGAVESQPGEAVEQEAHNFVTGFGAIAISSAAGKPHNDAEQSDSKGNMPDALAPALQAADAKDSSEGTDTASKKTTKKPVEEAMWEHARPFMQYVGTVADIWERFANALSPTPPFSRKQPLKIAAVFVPMLLASFIVTPYILMKALTFFGGVGFYSQPYINKGLNYLNTNYPGWQEKISLQNTLLEAVPTNAQLTITLLRIGEINHAPLPPPAAHTHKAKHAELVAGQVEAEAEAQEAEENEHEHGAQKPKASKRILGLFKGGAKGAVQTAIHTDHLKAKVVGSSAAKNRLGAVAEQKDLKQKPKGPKTYAARYRGVKGTAVIIESAGTLQAGALEEKELTTALQWTSDNGKESWTVSVGDIVEVEKLGGFGWKGKVVVGWTLDRWIVDAVRISYKINASITTETGQVSEHTVIEERLITAVMGREELVNRLLSMGNQRWECV
ncbi:hypothetical protein DFH27DRAFT_481765 [Peziza echinospora]|nr:hypothetical protein DFH27DRAFT_481765 [Peziza echinospora]